MSFGPDGKFYFNMGNAGTALQYADGSPVIDLQGNEVANEGKPYRQGMIFRCDIDLDHAKVEQRRDAGAQLPQQLRGLRGFLRRPVAVDNDDDGNKGVRINNIIDYGSYGYTDEMTGAGWQAARTNIEQEIPLQHWHQNDPGTIPNLLQTGQGSPTGICVNEGAALGKQFDKPSHPLRRRPAHRARVSREKERRGLHRGDGGHPHDRRHVVSPERLLHRAGRVAFRRGLV